MGKQPTMDPTALLREIAELRAANAGLAEAYRTAPVGLCRQDKGMKYIYINECLARINGLPMQDHIGKDMREILPPVAAGVEAEMLQVLETGEPVVNSTRNMETAAHPGVKRLYQYSLFP
jgi:PAS domain-containing protein